MAAINFPDDPEINDTISVGSTTWTWNGSVWQGSSSAGDAANDFAIAVSGLNTSVSFGVEYPTGNYAITSDVGDTTYDIYLFDSDDEFAGYTGIAKLTATAPFTKMVILGGTLGDILSFEYKTIFTAALDSDEFKAGPFVLSVDPTAVIAVDDTFEITGGNFATDCEVFLRGQDNVEVEAKSVVRTSGTSLLVTRPDEMPEAQSPYDVIVRNPGVTSPSSSAVNILQNSITPGGKPVWLSPATLSPFTKGTLYSFELIAVDPDGEPLTYSVVSGSLPSGLSVNSSTGVISGVPTGTTPSTATIRAEDPSGLFLDRAFTIPNSGPVWVTSSLPTAATGNPYTTTLVANDDSAIIPTFAVTTGSLPPGLSLNSSTGVISGTPTETSAGVTFTVSATDANGRSESKEFTMQVALTTTTTFTSNGTLTLPSTLVGQVEILAVAGGGGGGDGNAHGGGGGAGELIEGATTLTAGASYSVVIGTGGAGAPGNDQPGASGTNTSISLSGTTVLQAVGGGRGGGYQGLPFSGGSGGGGSGPSATVGPSGAGAGAAGVVPVGMTSYRNAGGNYSSNRGGGGGGAGGAGITGGAGGAGRSSSLSGTAVTYARGGDGGPGSDSPTGNNGNGGRAGNDSNSQNGQPGVVVVKYYSV
jgi:hypothetical protein